MTVLLTDVMLSSSQVKSLQPTVVKCHPTFWFMHRSFGSHMYKGCATNTLKLHASKQTEMTSPNTVTAGNKSVDKQAPDFKAQWDT